MDSNQLELLKSYNLCIVHISTAYNLNMCIDLNKLSTIIPTVNLPIIVIKNNKRYIIDVYPNGKLIINREIDPKSIIILIQEFINQHNISYNGILDVKKITIDKLRCEGSLLCNISTKWVLHNPYITLIKNDRIYYNSFLDYANVYIGSNGVIINSSSYKDTIYICKHIYTSFPAVLVVLNHMDNSIFSIIPNDIIGYILNFIYILNT